MRVSKVAARVRKAAVLSALAMAGGTCVGWGIGDVTGGALLDDGFVVGRYIRLRFLDSQQLDQGVFQGKR